MKSYNPTPNFRTALALGQFWRRLRLSKVRIQAVAIDMSGADWAKILEPLPGQ